jgi:hypothetical protein
MAKPTYDTKSYGTATTNSFSLAHTCTGSDLVLYAWFRWTTGGATNISDVAYAGAAMEAVTTATQIGGGKVQLFRKVGPATGANNITASFNNSIVVHCIGASFAGVDQADANETAVTDTDLSVEAGSVSADQMVLVCAGGYDAAAPGVAGFTSTGTSQTEREDQPGGGAHYLTVATQVAEGTVTSSFTYSETLDNAQIVTVIVNGIVAATGKPSYAYAQQ